MSDGTAVSAINDSSSTPSVTVGSFASSVLPTSNVEAESGTSNEPASADERFNASSYSIVDGGDRRNESNSIVNNNSSNNSGYSNDVSDSKNDNNFSEQPYGNSIPTYNSNCDRSVQPSSQLGLPPISSNGNNIYKEASASTNIWTNEKRLLPPPPAKIVETTTQQQQPAAGKNTMVDLIVNDFLDN